MNKVQFENIREFLEIKYLEYNQKEFITNDPITIPHKFRLKQDIEISGFFAAILAWGQRKTIINKCNELFNLMDNSPYDFIMNHKEVDLKGFLSFKHRTFNATDTLYFIHFLKTFYKEKESLEEAFITGINRYTRSIKDGLIHFHDLFFSLPDAPLRTRKHISTPATRSACKRLNMFLRWMVRKDDRGVDFGIWENISPSQLICPCDIHVLRVARHLGLILRKQNDWITAEELTENLRQFDPTDPVRYDFALFGLGVIENFGQ